MKKIHFTILLSVFSIITASAQVNPKLQAKVDQQAKDIESKVIAWRRHFHQYPELSNREFKTAAIVAEHLKSLGIEVKTGVAHTGVVGLLKGDKPGPVIALRADMDALPVTERNDLPFASKEKAIYNGAETGVMHACGHDSHTAILMGVAEILAKNKADLKGTVKFIFQPSEEGAPLGEEGGASLMVKEGVLENPKVDVIFGLHIKSISALGDITYKPGGMMAAADFYTIKVYGQQAHGGTPWRGVDPIVVSSQIILGLQTIISRQTELTKEPAIITIGKINSGVRENIIPEYAEMGGTVRTFNADMQKDIHMRMKRTITSIAESAGARAELDMRTLTPVTYNDPALTEKMAPSLIKAGGEQHVKRIPAEAGAEDFAYFQQKVPGLFIFIGACPPDVDPEKAPSHHTPDFMLDERGIITGVRALLDLTLDYMYMPK
jgi:amidohydrolase